MNVGHFILTAGVREEFFLQPVDNFLKIKKSGIKISAKLFKCVKQHVVIIKHKNIWGSSLF